MRRPLPEVNTPSGVVTLDTEPHELIPMLDRLLRESVGDVIEPRSRPIPGVTRVPRSHPKRIRVRPPKPQRLPNPDHHLWNNNGVWFVVYTIYPTPVTKERLRHSLQTRDRHIARQRRDHILAHCAERGILSRSGNVNTESLVS